MIIQPADLPGLRAKHDKHKFIFCSGSFDLLHPGHIWFFEQCKQLGEILVVSVGSDAAIAHCKPGRPILEETARLKMVDSLKSVDYCYLDTISTPEHILEGIWHAFENLRPDVYVIEDDAFAIGLRRDFCTGFGVEMRIVEKSQSEFPLMSTSAIIEKICSLQKR